MLPDIADARDNRLLFQSYDEADAIGLECQPHPSTQRSRPSGNLAFRFYPHILLDQAKGVQDQFIKRLESRFKTGLVTDQFRTQPSEFQALLVPAIDSGSAGIDRLIDVVEREFPFASEHSRIVLDGENKAEQLRAELEGASEVLVLTVGSMSGVTLSDINVQIQDCSDATPWGLTVHGRPASAREWETLVNSYSGNLAGVWVTLLPDRRLFEEEARAVGFASMLVDPDPGEAIFIERRINRAASGPSDWAQRIADYGHAHGLDGPPKFEPSAGLFDPYAVFWGMPQQGLPPEASERAIAEGRDVELWQADTRIRRGSYYGERLRAVSTLTSMGPAMQSAREGARQEAAPVRRRFDLASVSRLYFDPLLLASILRWCTPDEAWWGDGHLVAGLLQETVARFDHDDEGRRVLVGELLLAAIMGKVPRSGHDALRVIAEAELDDLPEGDVRAALSWGIKALGAVTAVV